MLNAKRILLFFGICILPYGKELTYSQNIVELIREAFTQKAPYHSYHSSVGFELVNTRLSLEEEKIYQRALEIQKNLDQRSLIGLDLGNNPLSVSIRFELENFFKQNNAYFYLLGRIQRIHHQWIRIPSLFKNAGGQIFLVELFFTEEGDEWNLYDIHPQRQALVKRPR